MDIVETRRPLSATKIALDKHLDNPWRRGGRQNQHQVRKPKLVTSLECRSSVWWMHTVHEFPWTAQSGGVDITLKVQKESSGGSLQDFSDALSKRRIRQGTTTKTRRYRWLAPLMSHSQKDHFKIKTEERLDCQSLISRRDQKISHKSRQRRDGRLKIHTGYFPWTDNNKK
jgi:hypothetical protein